MINGKIVNLSPFSSRDMSIIGESWIEKWQNSKLEPFSGISWEPHIFKGWNTITEVLPRTHEIGLGVNYLELNSVLHLMQVISNLCLNHPGFVLLAIVPILAGLANTATTIIDNIIDVLDKHSSLLWPHVLVKLRNFFLNIFKNLVMSWKLDFFSFLIYIISTLFVNMIDSMYVIVDVFYQSHDYYFVTFYW